MHGMKRCTVSESGVFEVTTVLSGETEGFFSKLESACRSAGMYSLTMEFWLSVESKWLMICLSEMTFIVELGKFVFLGENVEEKWKRCGWCLIYVDLIFAS